MPRENKSQYAILGLLNIQPMSGYELKKMCHDSISYFWNENFGSIYPVLRSLEAEKLVTSEKVAQVNFPDKKVYTITDTGRNQLQEWIGRPPALRRLREELLLQIFFGSSSNPDVLIEKLELRKEHCRSTISSLVELKNLLKPPPGQEPHDKPLRELKKEIAYRLQTISFGLHFYQCELKWCDESIQVFTEFIAEENTGNHSDDED